MEIAPRRTTSSVSLSGNWLEAPYSKRTLPTRDLRARNWPSPCLNVQVDLGSERVASQMKNSGGGVAVIPQSGNRRARPGAPLKAGFFNKQNGRVRHDVTAVSRSSGLAPARAAEVANHADGEVEKPKANGLSSADQNEGEQEVPPIIPAFEAARSPDLIAVDTTSMQLQWHTVRQLPPQMPPGLSSSGPDHQELSTCDVEYCLETRLVSWMQLRFDGSKCRQSAQ